MSTKSVDVDQFCVMLDNHAARTRRQLNMFVVAFIFICVENVVVGGEYGPGTPVDTGFLRAMWWLAINGSGESPSLQRPTGPRAAGEPMLFASAPPMDFVGGLQAGDLVELNNNTEYASYVENGTDHMPPHAMVRTVVNAAKAIALQAQSELGWSADAGLSVE